MNRLPRWLVQECKKVGLAWCSSCEALKPIQEFTANKNAANGLRSHCKGCCKEYQKKFIRTPHGRLYIRSRNIKNRLNLNISDEEAQRLAEQEYGSCEICKKACKLYVDHNHATGQYRGRLCRQCNVGLGHAEDSISRLQQMIAYLERTDTRDKYAEAYIMVG